MPGSWSETASWTDEQILNAQTIIRVGREVGATQRDITIALITAIQESALKNIPGGDRDSAGLFQQRPSMGWGSWDQVTDPEYAARTFYKGKPGNPGLFSIKDRDSLPLTVAAQKVQRSAFPDAYARHEAAALKLLGLKPAAAKAVAAPSAPVLKPTGLRSPAPSPGSTRPAQTPDLAKAEVFVETPVDAQLEAAQEIAAAAQAPGAAATAGGVGAAQAGGVGAASAPAGIGSIFDDFTAGDPLPEVDQPTFSQSVYRGNTPLPVFGGDGYMATGRGATAVTSAQSYLGTPYVWGGNGREGIDCSGLVQQVFRSVGIELPRLSADQARAGERVGLDKLRPGDLVAWDNSSRNNGADHIAIYAGDGFIIEAPRPGLAVRRRKLDDSDAAAWGVRMTRKEG